VCINVWLYMGNLHKSKLMEDLTTKMREDVLPQPRRSGDQMKLNALFIYLSYLYLYLQFAGAPTLPDKRFHSTYVHYLFT